jgi:hypothetical protein
VHVLVRAQLQAQHVLEAGGGQERACHVRPS